MQTLEIPVDAQQLVTQTEQDLAIAESFSISSNDGYAQAGEILKTIKGRYRDIENKRKDMTLPLDETKKRIMDFFRQPLERLASAERLIKGAMLSFTQEQERIRRLEEARIRELARLEQERRDRELEQRISQAQQDGDTAKAETLLATATEIATPVVLSQKPRVEGVKTMTRWKFRIVNEALIPREYLMPNERLLADTATKTKGSLEVPGVEFYPEQTIAASS